MTPSEIVERFASKGIMCRVEDVSETGMPCLDMVGSHAYVIGEDGNEVLRANSPARVMVPLFDYPNAEHVDKLALATKEETALDAILVVRSPDVVGMCVFALVAEETAK